MQFNEKKALLVLSGLVLIETTGMGMGFLDLVIKPFTTFVDSMIHDQSNGLLEIFRAIRRVLSAHERLREQAEYYWPVLDDSKKGVQWGEELERAAVPSNLGGRRKERVYPSGDSELYTSRIDHQAPHA